MRGYRCALCGGTVVPNQDGQTGKCEYCKTLGPLPKDRSEELQNAMNRANDFRLACDFDRAIDEYEKVLSGFSNEPEAHWGMLLSKYGVEYVQDEKTHSYSSKKLTLHRLSTISIFDDVDYNATINNASSFAKISYQQKAKEIDDTLKSALIEVKEQQPYDVFLCYKEVDEQTGTRTDDSYFVHDLYNELTSNGYKVFFAPKTLGAGVFESKIYAALVSARTMIVFGSKAEYFNAVWVKNEWKRFLEMKRRGENKEIIPVFRNASADILPVDLAGENALTANTIDFLPRLLTILSEANIKDKSENPSNEASVNGHIGLEKLVQNAETYLKLNKMDSAKDVYERITQDYPEDARGWWGLIVCETVNFTDVAVDLNKINTWFSYVKQLAKKTQYEEMEPLYLDYLYNVSCNQAKQEMDFAREQQAKLHMDAENLEQKNAFFATFPFADIEKQKNDKSTTISALNEKKSKYEMKMKSCDRVTSFCKILCISIVLIPIAFLIWFIRNWFADAYSSKIKFIDKLIEERTKEEEELEKKYQDERDKQKSVSKELKLLYYDLDNYQNFIDMNTDRLTKLLYYHNCKKIGIESNFDQEADDYRNAIFSSDDNKHIDGSSILDSSISCPACKAEIKFNRKAALEKGLITCSFCKTSITIMKKNQ